MNSHFPSSTQKVYPFCSNQPEEANVSMLNPDDSICVNYCNTMNQLLSDPKTYEKCITEIMKDDLYFKLLGYLNNYTQKVKLYMILSRKLEHFITSFKQWKRNLTRIKKFINILLRI